MEDRREREYIYMCAYVFVTEKESEREKDGAKGRRAKEVGKRAMGEDGQFCASSTAAANGVEGDEKWEAGGKRRRNIGFTVAEKINAWLHGEFARQ